MSYFSNFQIITIFFSFFIAFALAIFWHLREESSANNENEKEHFPVLMSVFFWSAFLAFALWLKINFLKNLDLSFMNQVDGWFFYFSLFLEEAVKAAAIIIWLEIAGKKFNEVSDGAIYWVFACLWFVFFENILYVLTFSDTFDKDYFTFMFERALIWFSSHLTIVFFSVFYAISYLKSPRLKNWNRPKPWHLILHIEAMWNWSYFLWFLYLLISPIILIINLIRKTKEKMGVVLYWSFFISVFAHILYDILIWLGDQYKFLAFIALAAVWFKAVVLYLRFDRLDN